jgi:hypothetical protein
VPKPAPMNTSRLDLSDKALADAILKVRSDASPETYCVFGYEGNSKIVLKDIGTGSCYECIDDMDEGSVSYALLRVTGTRDQESKTVKFVFICYVGPSVGGMQKGRVNGHKGDVKAMVGQSHVDIQADDKADLTEANITAKLKKASGANYDLGSNAGGAYESNAKSIGASAAAKYRELEKTSNIGPVVFDKGPAKPKDYVTPIDLGGRPTVAPPTQAKANTVIRDEKTAAQAEKDALVEKERLAALAARTKDGKTAATTPVVPVKISTEPAGSTAAEKAAAEKAAAEKAAAEKAAAEKAAAEKAAAEKAAAARAEAKRKKLEQLEEYKTAIGGTFTSPSLQAPAAATEKPTPAEKPTEVPAEEKVQEKPEGSEELAKESAAEEELAAAEEEPAAKEDEPAAKEEPAKAAQAKESKEKMDAEMAALKAAKDAGDITVVEYAEAIAKLRQEQQVAEQAAAAAASGGQDPPDRKRKPAEAEGKYSSQGEEERGEPLGEPAALQPAVITSQVQLERRIDDLEHEIAAALRVDELEHNSEEAQLLMAGRAEVAKKEALFASQLPWSKNARKRKARRKALR